jgi:hypothetical protein
MELGDGLVIVPTKLQMPHPDFFLSLLANVHATLLLPKINHAHVVYLKK